MRGVSSSLGRPQRRTPTNAGLGGQDPSSERFDSPQPHRDRGRAVGPLDGPEAIVGLRGGCFDESRPRSNDAVHSAGGPSGHPGGVDSDRRGLIPSGAAHRERWAHHALKDHRTPSRGATAPSGRRSGQVVTVSAALELSEREPQITGTHPDPSSNSVEAERGGAAQHSQPVPSAHSQHLRRMSEITKIAGQRHGRIAQRVPPRGVKRSFG